MSKALGVAALLSLSLVGPALAADPAPAPAAPPGPMKAEKPRLLINALEAGSGVDPSVANSLTDAVTKEVENRGFFRPFSQNEVQTLLGKERQAQLLGCSDESNSCLTELAGALGARFVMSGTVTKLGEAYQLTLQTLDSQKAQSVGRSVRIASSLDTLLAQLTYSVAEATGTPLPPPPSRILPYTMVGAGALAVVGGGVYGLIGLTQEGVINDELAQGASATNPRPLNTKAYYEDKAQLHATQRNVSLVAMLAGAALIGGGLLLNPPEAVSSGGPSIALVPAGVGFAFVGEFK